MYKEYTNTGKRGRKVYLLEATAMVQKKNHHSLIGANVQAVELERWKDWAHDGDKMARS